MRGLRPIWTGLLYMLGGCAVKPAAAREHGKRYRPAVNATSTPAFVPPLPAGEGVRGCGLSTEPLDGPSVRPQVWSPFGSLRPWGEAGHEDQAQNTELLAPGGR